MKILIEVILLKWDPFNILILRRSTKNLLLSLSKLTYHLTSETDILETRDGATHVSRY